MDYRTLITCGLLAVLLLTSCSPAPIRAVDFVQSDVERTSPDASTADLEELVQGNSAFSWDLYQNWRDEEGNLFYSPYSISLALAMTYAGARGQTEWEMKEVLHLILSSDRLHPAFNALDLELARRGEEESSREGKTFELNIANSIWGQKGYKFLSAFLDLLAENYGAGLRLTDFAKDPEGSRVAINDWVSDQTNEKIEDLIPQGLIDEMTRLVLANAIYFNASWLHPFDESRTEDAPFYLLNGGEVTVPMMSMSHSKYLLYAEGDGYKVVELPYEGRKIAMTIIVPDAGNFEQLEASLVAEEVDAILASLEHETVSLRLPKFSYESSFKMAKTLAEMGMPSAFGAEADFSGIDGTKELFISAVVHKAFVAVDEAGTEAAAATAVIIAEKGAPMSPVELTVDRPFIFVIRDVETGSTLFVGRVVNPAS